MFVGDQLLAESSMRDDPLNPMTGRIDWRAHFQRQAQGKVGLVPFAVVAQGAAVIKTEMHRLAAMGVRHGSSTR